MSVCVYIQLSVHVSSCAYLWSVTKIQTNPHSWKIVSLLHEMYWSDCLLLHKCLKSLLLLKETLNCALKPPFSVLGWAREAQRVWMFTFIPMCNTYQERMGTKMFMGLWGEWVLTKRLNVVCIWSWKLYIGTDLLKPNYILLWATPRHKWKEKTL